MDQRHSVKITGSSTRTTSPGCWSRCSAFLCRVYYAARFFLRRRCWGANADDLLDYTLMSGDELDFQVGQFVTTLQKRQKMRSYGAVFLAGLGLSAVLATALFDRTLISFFRGETTITGDLHYLPSHTVDPGIFTQMDLKRVHQELLPSWAIVSGRMGMHSNRQISQRAFEMLIEEVGKDPNLGELLNEMQLIVSTRQYLTEADRMQYLLWAWNDYLARHGQPYWVRGNAHYTQYNAFFYMKTYHVLDRPEVNVGRHRYPVGLVTRIDVKDTREPYLGAASKRERGAFVVVDRIHDFVVDRIWPVFDASDDQQLDPVASAFAKHIRHNALLSLAPEDMMLLVQTAPQRRAMMRAIASINSREHCSGNVIVGGVPWDGIKAPDLELLESVADAWASDPCPAVTLGEAYQMINASLQLRQTPGLQDAVGGLVSWLARSVAIHEVRHIADSDQFDGLAKPLECAGCPAAMSTVVRAETSAYLASLAWSDAPATALYQACQSVYHTQSAHGLALHFILDQLDLHCEMEPPANLAQRARQLEQDLFGRADAISFTEFFPQRLVLPQETLAEHF